MRISTQQIHQQAVAGMQRQQLELSRTQAQLASGEKLASAADDPTAYALKMSLDDGIAQVQSYQRNAGLLGDRLALTESVVAEMEDSVARIRELAVQAGGVALNDTDRAAIALEIRQQRDNLLALANSSDGQGRYLFAGTSDQSAAFSEAGGAIRYDGNQGQRELRIDSHQSVAENLSGDQLLMRIPAGADGFDLDFDQGNSGSLQISSAAASGR